MNNERVVVTGVGGICSVGNTVPAIWDGLLNGRSGIGPITKFDATGFRSTIAGEVKNFDVTAFVSSKEARRQDPFCHFAIAASDEALAAANIDADSPIDRGRVGVLIGSGIGGVITLEQQIHRLRDQGPGKVSPFLVPMMIGDMASGAVSIRHGFRGPNYGLESACASGTHAIGEAFWALRRGDADMMVAGGSESCVCPICCAGFCSLKALSPRQDEPEKASRPFDAERDGFVLAEGAGILVMETLSHAKARQAPILAEVIGYGASGDAHHVTAPPADGSGAVAAIKTALTHAGINPGEVSYINAHGTSTPMNDRVETQAIKTVFGDDAYRIPVSSTKALMGHTLGAAGGLETMICVKAISEGAIPGTYNYEHPDPDCDLDYVPNESREQAVNVALNMNFGFGGHNAVLALRKFAS